MTGHPRLLQAARAGFLLAVAAATYLAFRGHGDDVATAVRATPVPAVGLAALLVLAGLVTTSVAWLRVLGGFGHRLTGREGRAVFFLGQLGKYVPGGVWSIGAHAHLAGAHAVPARVTASTSLVFLGLNVATSALVVGASTAAGSADTPWPRWVGPLVVLAGLVALLPPVVNRLAGAVAGRSGCLRLRPLEVVRLAGLLLVTWGCYAAAVVVITPEPSWSLLGLTAVAFALSYAVGVAVVVAPAGVGAREVTLVALLAPTIGVGPAGAVAILTRLLHTGADLVLALVMWLAARSRRTARTVRVPSDAQA
ncbi:MAG: hypothetical protein LH468_10885 [Nocardioides sp.]|nr:hypothetical protein [Nocardioides sp.]